MSMYRQFLIQYRRAIGKIAPSPKTPYKNVENLGVMYVMAKDKDDAFEQVRKAGYYPYRVLEG